jgi:hypothetical protein
VSPELAKVPVPVCSPVEATGRAETGSADLADEGVRELVRAAGFAWPSGLDVGDRETGPIGAGAGAATRAEDSPFVVAVGAVGATTETGVGTVSDDDVDVEVDGAGTAGTEDGPSSPAPVP